jgi:ParB/RepB/Spo0J family partition protein
MNPNPTTGLRIIALTSIVEAPGFNPREDYGQECGSFEELTESIRESGVLVPPIVFPQADTFVLLAGHRRVRAAREVGLTEIPCIVREDGVSVENLVVALVENLRRKDLTTIEKAKGFARLRDGGLSEREIAQRLGCTQQFVGRTLDLLTLPPQAQQALEAKQLPALAGYELAKGIRHGVSPTKTTAIAKEAVRDNLTSYEVKEKVAAARGETPRSTSLSRSPEPSPLPVRPTTIMVSIELSFKADVDWALQRYGSIGGALAALRHMSEKTAKMPDELEKSLTGTSRDPMHLVRQAQAKRWPTILLGLNTSTGGMVALEKGPLPFSFVLVAEVLSSGKVHIPMTANGRGRTVGEQIKDAIEGRRRAGTA